MIIYFHTILVVEFVDLNCGCICCQKFFPHNDILVTDTVQTRRQLRYDCVPIYPNIVGLAKKKPDSPKPKDTF